MYVKGAEWSLVWEHWKLVDPGGNPSVMGTEVASAGEGNQKGGLEDNHQATGRMKVKRHYWA